MTIEKFLTKKSLGLKQVILVRTDLKMPIGKLSAQVAHASVDAVLLSKKKKVNSWKMLGMKKICLKVNTLEELKKIIDKAKKAGLQTSLITDAGKTFFKTPTITCGAIGPDKQEEIDKITKDLKIL